MKLPGVAANSAPIGRGAPKQAKGKGPSQEERAQIFIHLATVHTELGQTPEAAKIIQDAKGEFYDTPAHAQIIIVDANLALRRGDVQAALNLLKKIEKSSPHYTKARIAAANIHLTHRHDKKVYIRYFEELKDENKDSIAACCMLAEAHMRLQEPGKAVLAYQEARKLEEKQQGDRTDSDLAGKIGQAFISSHDFQGAIQYLEEAVKKQSGKLGLRLTLADLFMKLSRTDDAIAACGAAEDMLGDNDSIENLMSRTRVLQLKAKIYKRAGSGDEYAQCLVNANAMQSRILGRLRGEAAELGREKKVAADICAELAKHHEQHKRYNDALGFYGEALKHDDRHAEAMISLAKLHMDREEFAEARKQCQALLKHDLETETATMMLADIMFRSNEFDEAIRYFAQMLEHKANNYKALEQLILLVRRAGRLHETASNRQGDAVRFLRLAERSSARSLMEGGYHYCKGLYARYTRNFPEALEELNQVRAHTHTHNRYATHTQYTQVG